MARGFECFTDLRYDQSGMARGQEAVAATDEERISSQVAQPVQCVAHGSWLSDRRAAAAVTDPASATA